MVVINMRCRNPVCTTVFDTDGKPSRPIKSGWCSASACKKVRAASCRDMTTRATLDAVAVALGLVSGQTHDTIVYGVRDAMVAVVTLNVVAETLGMPPGHTNEELRAELRRVLKKRKRVLSLE